MVVQHNLSAMNSNRQLGITTGIQAKSSEKLSSGYKINRAADDAAGLAISEKMRRQIRGLTQASNNAQDGVSMVQIADGAMAEVHDMLQRGNELAVKAANDTLTTDDRSYIQAEIDRIKEEVDAINGKTTFNEIFVLRGKYYDETDTGYVIEGGLPDFVEIDTSSKAAGYMTKTHTTSEPYTLKLTNGTEITGNVDVNHEATEITFPAGPLTNAQKQELIGTGFYVTCCTCDNHYSIAFTDGKSGQESSGNHYIFNIDVSSITDGESLVDAILAQTGEIPTGHYTHFIKDSSDPNKLITYDGRSNDKTMNQIKEDILTAKGVASADVLSLTYNNWRTLDQSTATASSVRGLVGEGVARSSSEQNKGGEDIILQVGSETSSENQIIIELPYISSKTCSIDKVSVLSHESAKRAIESFKDGLQYVSQERSRMGAYQNRLEHTIKNLDNVVENTQAAESRIRDTDMASEMVRYSNNNILAQAGQSMLAQANQTNQGVLNLLQ
jgi:flagellin